MITRASLAAAGLAALLAVAGCAHRTIQGPTTYRTVTVTPSAPASSVASSPVATTRSSAAPNATMRVLPGTCDSLLMLGTIVDAVGHPVAGDTAFVVGAADPATGRVSYLNCRYGLTRAAPNGSIEIGVSLYRTAAEAAARIAPTIEDFTQRGATPKHTTVAGSPATQLTGGQGAGYGPTVVLAAGQRTVAVTVASSAADALGDLRRLTALAAQRTSGT
ncbi:MAG: hypothetical protein ACRDVG_16060 [Jatrophihabitantaceae bacterium]